MPKGKLNPADRLLTDQQIVEIYQDPPLIPVRYAMALMFDEGVNQQAIPLLLDRLDRLIITTVQQEGLTGEVSDFRLLAHARKIACTLVVDDAGYYWIDRRLHALGLSHAGIIVVSSGTDLGLRRLLAFVEGMYLDLVQIK
jgi:hypothetical protein